MTMDELTKILAEHAKWLDGKGGTRARLTGADLTDADLTDVKDDVLKILASAPAEAPAVLAALREGKVDGSTYSGECAGLVGTIANARPGSDLAAVQNALGADARRPAEMFFSAIQQGDTPATNPVSALAATWVEEFLKTLAPAEATKATSPRPSR